MKTFNKILVVCSAIMALASCEESFNPYAVESAVKVIKSDVTFQAPASTGTIEVEAEGAFTIECDSPWVSYEVSGSTITVSVAENGAITGRTAVLKIHCGEDVASIAVMQAGLIFECSAGSKIVVDSDDANSLSYSIKTNLKLTFTPSADWFSADLTEDGILNINLTANNTGAVRTGYLTYASETMRDSLEVVQFAPAKDIAGEAYLFFYESANAEQQTYFPINIKEDMTGFTIPALGFEVPFEFDKSNMTLTFSNAAYYGTYGSYYVRGMLLSPDGYLTYSTTAWWDAPIEFDEDDSLMAPMGGWDGTLTNFSRGMAAMMFYAFNDQTTVSSAAAAGSLIRMYHPVIVRFKPE